MKKIELEKAVAEKLKVSQKEAENIIETVVNEMVAGTKETGSAPFGKVGRFKYVDVKERGGHINGVDWVKPAHKTIKFSLSKSGKEL